jgi:TolA-binding protein
MAHSTYLALLNLSPNNWEAMFELGMTSLSLGRNNDARQFLQDLITRNPGFAGRAEAERILATL